MTAVTICSDFGVQDIKFVTVSIVSPSICHEGVGLEAMNFRFLNVVLNQLFDCPLSLSSRGFLVFLHFLL